MLQFASHNRLQALHGCKRPAARSASNRGRDEMTTNDQVAPGQKLFGIGVFNFVNGLVWFDYYRLPNIFTLRSSNGFDAFFRAQIVIGVIVAAYGMLVWRSATRKLSLANFTIVSCCVAVLLLCVSRLSEWFHFLDQQRGSWLQNDLAVVATQITISVCLAVSGGWWADSTYIRERFRRYVRSSRFAE